MARGKRAAGPPITSYEAPSVDEQAAAEMSPGEQVQRDVETKQRNSSERDTERISRLSVPLTGSQGIDWEHMRESNKEQVKKVIGGWLRDPKIAADFGIERPLIQVFSPDQCGYIYDAIGQAEVAMAPKLFGVSHAAAVAAFRYSDADKAALAKPTADVINKYALDWMIRFREEIALAFLIFTITGAKIALAKQLTLMEIEQAKAAGKPNGKPLETHVEAAA